MFARDNCMNLYPPAPIHPIPTPPSTREGLNVNVHKKKWTNKQQQWKQQMHQKNQNAWAGFFLPLPTSVVSRPK